MKDTRWALVATVPLLCGALLGLVNGRNARIDGDLDRAVALGAAPSVSLAIVRDGKLVYAGARGEDDVARHLAAGPATRYPLSSLGSTMIAVAIGQLVEEGRVSFGDTLATYDPSDPNNAKLTLRTLIQQRSQRADERLAFVVERATGISLPEFLARNVFPLAGMRETAVGYAPQTREAIGYTKRCAAWIASPPPQAFVTSTARDVAKFDIALFDGRLLAPTTLAKLIDLGVGKPGHVVRGFGGIDEIDPTHENAVVVLDNSAAFSGAALAASAERAYGR